MIGREIGEVNTNASGGRPRMWGRGAGMESPPFDFRMTDSETPAKSRQAANLKSLSTRKMIMYLEPSVLRVIWRWTRLLLEFPSLVEAPSSSKRLEIRQRWLQHPL
jgi:hypothetical protein